MAFAPAASAQLADQLTDLDHGCAGDVGNIGNCTAGEIAVNQVTNVIFAGNPTNCIAGQPLTIESASVEYQINTQQRYNLMLWLSKEEGTDPREGAAVNGLGRCVAASVPAPFDLAQVNPLNPFTDLDVNGTDVCADVDNFTGAVFRNFTNITLECQDNDNDGFADVNVLLTWQQNSSANCGTGPADEPIFPIGSPSKCDYQTLNTVLPIVEPATLTVIKNSVGDTANFDFSWSSTNNAATPFSLDTTGDNTEQQSFQIVTGLGDTDFSVGETLPANWSLGGAECVDGGGSPVGSLNGTTIEDITIDSGDDITCTFTNLAPASLTVTKNSIGDTANFEFSSDLSGLAPTFFLDTSGDNTESVTQANIPITSESGLAFFVSEVVPAGWALQPIVCTNGDASGTNVLNGTLLPGDDVTCTFNNVRDGGLTIEKLTLGGDGSFDYTSTGGNELPANFNIQTNNNIGLVNYNPITPGQYTVTEVVPAGWQFVSVSCNDPTGNSGPGGGTTVNIDIAAGESVTCSFINVEFGTIIIEKDTVPTGGTGFGFTTDIPGATSPFSLDDGDNATYMNVPAGAYTVTENDPTPAFDLTGLSCVEDANQNTTTDLVNRTTTINLDAGETVTCTFTNRERGSVTVIKSVTADGPAETTFDFTTDVPGATSPFSLGPVTQGNDVDTTFDNVQAGVYSVFETDPTADGWVNVSATCDDGSSPAAIDLAAGEDVICTFVNAPLGSATIVKSTVGGDDTFGFEWGTGINPNVPEGFASTFDLATVAGTASMDFSFALIPLDPYDLTETTLPAGWSLTNVTCSDPTADSTFNPGENGADATIVSQSEETVSCTFTNTADGTLIIRKETLPDASAQAFTFTGDAAGSIHDFSDTAEQITFAGQPDVYTSTETVPGGWTLTGIACTGAVNSTVTIGNAGGFDPGDEGVSVDLAAGETVICTFENTANSSITIVKQTVGGDGLFNFNSTELGNFAIDTSIDPDEAFTGLLPDTYMVSETIPTGWALTNIVCSGESASTITIGGAGGFDPGDQGVTIDLVPGEDITCTFTNTELGSITVEKQTLPDGSPTTFDFTGDASGTITDGQSIVVPNLLPGTYTSTETVPADWNLTDITCSDGDSTGDTGTETATFNVAPGEDVTCVFTNTQRATITLVKNLPNDNGGDAVEADFQAYINGNPVPWGAAQELVGGNYTASEDTLPGYDASAWGGDCAADGSVTLNPGDALTCSITNDDVAPTLTLIKNVITDDGGNAGPDDFGISVGGNPVVSGASNAYDANVALAIDEAGLTGYNFVSISGDAKCPAALGGTVTLDEGENVTCTITNDDQAPGLTLIKNVINDNGGNAGPDDFGISVNGSTVTSGVNNDYPANTTLTIDEAGLDGYTFVSITGDDKCPAALGGSLSLDPGEAISCTITNDDVAPTLTLLKVIDGGTAAPTDFALTLTGADGTHGAGVNYVSGNQPAVQANVPYTVTEAPDQVANYNLNGIVCRDDSDASQVPQPVSLDEGQSVTCEVTNTFGEIIIYTPTPVPANQAWALVLMLLSMLGMAWYFRPGRVRVE